MKAEDPRSSTGWLAWACAAWAAFVVAWYWKDHPVELPYLVFLANGLAGARPFNGYMLKGLEAAAVAAWILWLARRAGEEAAPSGLSLLERLSLETALGLGFLSLAVLILGLGRLWYAGVFWVLLAAGTAFFLLRRRPPPAPRPTTLPPGRFGLVLWCCLVAVLLNVLLNDLSPELFYDSLFYHLGVPNLYRLAHRIYPVDMLYASLVMSVQMIYGLADTLGGFQAAKLLHAASAALIVLLYGAIEERYLGRRPGAALASSLLLLSMPISGMNLGVAGIEGVWSYFQLAAAYALLRSLDEPSPAWTRFAGLLTGLSASCKYPGLPFIPIACVVMAWRRREEGRPWREIWTEAHLFLHWTLLFVLPHLVKNVFFHGNPIYPFLGTHWGSPRIEPRYWTAFLADAHQRDLRAAFGSWSGFARFALHPWFITQEGRSNADFVGPLWLAVLPALFFKPRSPALRSLRRYGLLLWLLWLFTSDTPRYGLPALALLAPVTIEMVASIWDSNWAGRLGWTAFTAGCVLNLCLCLAMTAGVEGWSVVGGLVGETEYLSNQRQTYPTPPYAGIHWMNERLPAGSKVLFLGDARSYYLNIPAIPSSPYDPDMLVQEARTAKDGPALAAALRARGVTHIYLNFAEAVRDEGYGLFKWDSRSWAVLSEFWARYADPEWSVEQLIPGEPMVQYVFGIRGEEEAAKPHPVPPNPFARWAPKEPAL